MKDKLLFWMDADLTHYGIAKYIADSYDCQLFGIFDITSKPKQFFKSQELVKFEKIWFYHDNIKKTSDKPDVSYLAEFERRYNINLWLIAYNDRIFFNHNEFYRFSVDEVLKILEQTCKFFEETLDEIKPDFVVMRSPELLPQKILYEICKIRGIMPLLLGQMRFANRYSVSKYWHNIDPIKQSSNRLEKDRTFDELMNFLKGTSMFNRQSDIVNKFWGRRSSRIKALYKFLTTNNENVKTHYTYYGRTRLRVLIIMSMLLLRGKIREFYINRKLIRVIKKDRPFFFFPLHVDVEATLLLGAPFHTNQIEIIKNIVKSLPVGYELYVKEHPVMRVRGWHSIQFYKEIMSFPNVKVLHHSLSPYEIMKECSGVLSITSTAGLEAVFHQKPSIIFADAPFSKLPSVYRVKDMEELPRIIHASLKTKVNVKDLNDYVDLIIANSFQFDQGSLEQEYSRIFYYDGNSVDVEITAEKMSYFLEQHKKEFEKLSFEYIQKIQYYKGIKNTQ